MVHKNDSISTEPFEKKKPTECFRKIFERYVEQEGYKLLFEDGVEGSDKEIDIPGADKITPFKYLQQILGYASYSEDVDETPENKRSFYTFYISDVSGDKTIIVDRINNSEISNTPTDIIFDWMNGKDDIVLNFTTDYNAMVPLSSPYAEEFSERNRSGIDNQGKEVAFYGRSTPETGYRAKSEFIYEKQLWAKCINYVYKAQLQTIGIPCEFSLVNAYIKVIPLIYGKAHHTQGVYQVTKITDTINSSGFVSSYELIKCASKETEQLYLEDYSKIAIDKAKAAGVYIENKKEVVDGTQYGIVGSSGGSSGAFPSASGQRGKLLEIASLEMGKNYGGEKFWRYMGQGGRVEWCACFVSWCLNEAGLYPSTVDCQSMACYVFMRYFEGRGQWQKGRGYGGNYIPNPGDIILFNWNGYYGNDFASVNHIGIVKYSDGSTVYTYEGNTSDMCAERSYDINTADILGYGVY